MDHTHIECDFLRGLFLKEKGEAICPYYLKKSRQLFRKRLKIV